MLWERNRGIWTIISVEKLGEGDFFYIFCFANMKKRGLISYVLGLQTFFSLLENTTESV